MFCIVGFTCTVAYVAQRNLADKPKLSVLEEIFSKDEIYLPGGQHITRAARTDIQRENKESFFENPNKPDNYWISPMAERSLNAPGKRVYRNEEY